MDDSGSWGDDYSGVAPAAGPRGQLPRRDWAAKFSILAAILGLACAIGGIAFIAIGELREIDLLSMVQLSVVLAITSWVSVVIGGGFAVYAVSGPGTSRSLGDYALWLNVALLVLSAILAVMTAWYVIIPLLFIAWLLFGTKS